MKRNSASETILYQLRHLEYKQNYQHICIQEAILPKYEHKSHIDKREISWMTHKLCNKVHLTQISTRQTRRFAFSRWVTEKDEIERSKEENKKNA